MIATSILMFLMVTAGAISSNFFSSIRNIQAANVVYGEADFAMERVMREIRNGTVDYEEYYNQQQNYRGGETGTNRTLGQNYCEYSQQFYGDGPDGKPGTFDDESTGLPKKDENTGQRKEDSPVPISAPIQQKLYLIDASGQHRTYFQRVEITLKNASGVERKNADGTVMTIGKIAMLKLVGKDYGIDHYSKLSKEFPSDCPVDGGEGDGIIDTWECDTGFKCAKDTVTITLPNGSCQGVLWSPLDTPKKLDDVDPSKGATDNAGKSSYVDITPDTIDVVSLEFVITPPDDPRKAYNEPSVQLQPNVSVKIVARASQEIASTFKGKTPSIVLNSTVSARATKEIITECNLKECVDSNEEEDKRPCPKNTGIFSGAKQACSQGVWPGCSETYYLLKSQDNIKTNVLTLGIKGSGLLGALTDSEKAAIAADGKDHVSPFQNTPKDFYESSGSENGSCLDDACRTRRCSDGVDNDVNGKKDNEDLACLTYICNNGILDTGENCIDVGGICSFRPKVLNESPNYCADGYDNDCSYNLTWSTLTPAQLQRARDLNMDSLTSLPMLRLALGLGADEYDQNCIDLICTNGVRDPMGLGTFGPQIHQTPNYLLPKSSSDQLNEKCVDIGGLCEKATIGNHKWVGGSGGVGESGTFCFDGLDNDCDYIPSSAPDPINNPDSRGADEFDSACKPAICSNLVQDSELASKEIIVATNDPTKYFYDFLVNYSDPFITSRDPLGQSSLLDEICTNSGGICGPNPNTISENPSLCFDGKDNNCDGKFDGNQGANSDLGCCGDVDGDLFFPSSPTCRPLTVDTGGGTFGTVDCNDSDRDIKPGALEVCDNANYPNTNNPIDNNCSGANKPTGSGDTGWDRDDPTCCFDFDSDGFGRKGENLYKLPGSPKCASVLGQPDQERTTYDCRDADPLINPNVRENTVPLCSDKENNSCRFVVTAAKPLDILNTPRMDHIDMYVQNTNPTGPGSLMDAFTFQNFNPDCCELTQNPKFPGMEICDGRNSLLAGSPIGSDENCNGLAGMNDHYCVAQNGMGFHDSLTTSQFINPATDANHDKVTAILSIVPPTDPSKIALSNTIPLDSTTCRNVASATLNADLHVPAGTSIQFSLSNDGGNSWRDVPPGNVHTFATRGNNLKWQATLNSDGISLSPTIHYIDLTWTCS